MAIINITDSGFVTTNQNDILNQLIEIFKGVYGDNTYVVEGTEDYNMLSALASLFNDMGMVANSVSNGMNLASATGFQLDNIATLFYNKVNRSPATYSTVDVEIKGSPNVTIVAGQVKDVTGGIWNLRTTDNLSDIVTIGESGTVNALAVQTIPGAYYIDANQITGFGSIVTPVAGWTDVNNPTECNIGENVESDAKFRYRLAVAAQGTSNTVYNTLYSNIINLPNVSSVNIWENDGGDPKSFADVSLKNVPAHSITISVFGDSLDNEKVAQAIYDYKGTGVGTYAPPNHEETETEPAVTSAVSVIIKNAFNQPQTINFVKAENENTYVNVVLMPLNQSSLSEELIAGIQSAIIDVFTNLKIGGKIYATELYVPISQAITNIVGANSYNIQSVTIRLEASPTGTNIQYTYDQKPFTTDTFITVTSSEA